MGWLAESGRHCKMGRKKRNLTLQKYSAALPSKKLPSGPQLFLYTQTRLSKTTPRSSRGLWADHRRWHCQWGPRPHAHFFSFESSSGKKLKNPFQKELFQPCQWPPPRISTYRPPSRHASQKKLRRSRSAILLVGLRKWREKANVDSEKCARSGKIRSKRNSSILLTLCLSIPISKLAKFRLKKIVPLEKNSDAWKR